MEAVECFGGGLDAVEAAVDGLAGCDPAAMTDAEQSEALVARPTHRVLLPPGLPEG